jgi:hypothetical protein
MKATPTVTCKSFCEIFHKVPALLPAGHKKPGIHIKRVCPFPGEIAGDKFALLSMADRPETRFSQFNLHL